RWSCVACPHDTRAVRAPAPVPAPRRTTSTAPTPALACRSLRVAAGRLPPDDPLQVVEELVLAGLAAAQQVLPRADAVVVAPDAGGPTLGLHDRRRDPATIL